MKYAILAVLAFFGALVQAMPLQSSLFIKTAGNPAESFPLTWHSLDQHTWELKSDFQGLTIQVNQKQNVWEFSLTANQTLHFNLQNRYLTQFAYDESEFLMPGLWYKKNDRSSLGAPSIKEAQSWSFREDRLSTPITGVFDVKSGRTVTILRDDIAQTDSLAVPVTGEIMLNSHTDLGSLGFGVEQGRAYLQFGYPYEEAPKTYIRKLTLAPQSQAFMAMQKGQTITLRYQIQTQHADNFSDFVRQTWQYSIDNKQPQSIANAMSTEDVKAYLSQFYVQSYIENNKLAGFSGVHLTTANAETKQLYEIGFVGRVLLNAFNAMEYGEQVNNPQLIEMAKKTFDAYLKNGFNKQGFWREVVDFDHPREELANTLSIRRQSEGIYAALLYMQYQKHKGIDMSVWDSKIHHLLNQLARLQTQEGAFPRKFTPKSAIIDGSGGSSPSAVLAYVMAYKYFNEPKYLAIAKHTARYLEAEIVQPAEYFSSTLDANCVDKEAAFYTAMAFYYLALVTDDAEQQQYTQLTEKANYFVMSWYYTWDVPFAKGQMLGDVGFKSRGWGNVSVENNHIDVFIFGYLDVLNWLAEKKGDTRLANFADVIESSMKSQLLPREGHMFNIGKVGYYPEVVQHTNWDYGHFGKGFYNDIFAPGWVVASLWEMLTPHRAADFLQAKHSQR